ncbi:MAG: M23 family metallopeptidase [Alphaproteobacteria bacterium]|nr:M23 family metallopeptidase [Alphaproteobacteria bacterium]
MADPRPEHRYTVLLVPEDGRGEVKQLVLTRAGLRRGLLIAALGGGLAMSMLIVAALSLAQLADHRALASENIFLRGRLSDIELKLQRVDQAMRRVQLHDSQLREAIEDNPRYPGFGPLEDDEVEALGLPPDDPDALQGSAAWPLIDGEPMDDHTLGPAPEELRPAEAWAVSVEARTEDFLRRLNHLEPRLGLLAEDVEDMLSLTAAFPSFWPVDGVLTSGFGYRRSPINNRRKFHSGIDISAPRGTRVHAASAGVVTMAQYNSGYGRMITIDHGYGVETRYAHNSSLFVKEGDWVDRGQIIATVGTTGQTTGPHLHFELTVDGQAIDPLEYLPN